MSGLNPGLNNFTGGGGLVDFAFDAIAADYSGSDFDVYTYYQGGLTGTVAATLTVTWTDATKTVLLNVVRI